MTYIYLLSTIHSLLLLSLSFSLTLTTSLFTTLLPNLSFHLTISTSNLLIFSYSLSHIYLVPLSLSDPSFYFISNSLSLYYLLIYSFLLLSTSTYFTLPIFSYITYYFLSILFFTYSYFIYLSLIPYFNINHFHFTSSDLTVVRIGVIYIYSLAQRPH